MPEDQEEIQIVEWVCNCGVTPFTMEFSANSERYREFREALLPILEGGRGEITWQIDYPESVLPHIAHGLNKIRLRRIPYRERLFEKLAEQRAAEAAQ